MVQYYRSDKGSKFTKGVLKGGAAFGTGYVGATAIVATSGKQLSFTTNPPLDWFNPYLGPTQAANLVGLVSSLLLSGFGSSADSPKTKAVAKIIGYAIAGGLGFSFAQFTIDPPGDVTGPMLAEVQPPRFIPTAGPLPPLGGAGTPYQVDLLKLTVPEPRRGEIRVLF